MHIQEFLSLLQTSPHCSLRFVLPSGKAVPDHFHVTEVGRIDKQFVDCGGTRRSASTCSLQLWVADDTNHRLQSGKLAQIIQLAQPILGTDELPIEVEYGTDVAAQYQVEGVQQQFSQLFIRLAGKQTDCLAKEKCCPEAISTP